MELGAAIGACEHLWKFGGLKNKKANGEAQTPQSSSSCRGSSGRAMLLDCPPPFLPLLLQSVIVMEPEGRLSSRECVNHPYFEGLKEEFGVTADFDSPAHGHGVAEPSVVRA